MNNLPGALGRWLGGWPGCFGRLQAGRVGGCRAREQLKNIFAPIIRKRRETGAVEEDVLQSFIEARYRNVDGGRSLTEDEITGLLIAVLFAGQHTSSITSSWTGFCMLTHLVTPLP